MSLLRTAARTAVITSTATRVHQRTAARQQGRWAEPAPPQPAQVAPPVPAQAAAPPVPAQPTADTSELLDQLTRLGALRDQGVLTPEEFELQKARILRHA